MMFRMIKFRSNKMYGFFLFLHILTQMISIAPLLSCRLRNHIVCMDVLILVSWIMYVPDTKHNRISYSIDVM